MSAEGIVRRIYEALCSLDPAEMKRVGGEYFADDIVVREPESLPWGGAYEGKNVVIGLMSNIGDPASPIDAANLAVDNLISTPQGDAHQVIAAVSFPWRGTGAEPLPMTALEWFTVRDGKVTEIRIYLWDTAAGIAALGESPN